MTRLLREKNGDDDYGASFDHVCVLGNSEGLIEMRKFSHGKDLNPWIAVSRARH